MGRGIGVIWPTRQATHYGPNNETGMPLWVGAIYYSDDFQCLLLGTREGKGWDRVFELRDGQLRVLGTVADHSIGAIAEFRGAVLVGTTAGMFQLGEQEATRLTPDQALPCEIRTCLHCDSFGTLWIGTEGVGLGRYDGSLLVALEIPGGPTLTSSEMSLRTLHWREISQILSR